MIKNRKLSSVYISKTLKNYYYKNKNKSINIGCTISMFFVMNKNSIKTFFFIRLLTKRF